MNLEQCCLIRIHSYGKDHYLSNGQLLWLIKQILNFIRAVIHLFNLYLNEEKIKRLF